MVLKIPQMLSLVLKVTNKNQYGWICWKRLVNQNVVKPIFKYQLTDMFIFIIQQCFKYIYLQLKEFMRKKKK